MSAKKTGLGRNLNELLGEKIHTNTKPSASRQVPIKALQELPVEFLVRGKYQPRGDMDQQALQELADSIKAQGLIQPIIVRAHGDKYEIIAGERRWRAAQLAGLSDVPVVVKTINDEQASAMALIENVQREDLNPMEEARALRRLSEEFNASHQTIATSVGKSRAHVSNLIRLNQCHPDVQTLLERGQIEMGHARAMLALTGEQQAILAKQVVTKSLSVRATEQQVKKMLSTTTTITQPVVSPNIQALENKLSEKFAAKVTIQHLTSGKGKLTLHYNSVDEFDGILAQLKLPVE